MDITLDVTLTLELAAARQPLDFDLDLAVHGLDLYRALARAHTAARALARPGSSHFAAGFGVDFVRAINFADGLARVPRARRRPRPRRHSRFPPRPRPCSRS